MPEIAGIYFSDHQGGQGDLPPVVLLHGAGGSYLTWPSGLRRLPGQRVLAVDLPGHGHSRGVALQSIEEYAEALRGFLEQLGLREVVLVGHSMGGAVALVMALQDPRLVAGLGLLSTGASLSVDSTLVEELSNPVTFPAGLHHLQQLSLSPFAPPALVDACMRPLRETRPSLLLADWRACARFDVRAQMDAGGTGLRAPAWIGCGAEDRITPLACAHFLAAHFPGAELQMFPGAGHLLPLEQPDAVAGALRQFLTSHLPAIESYRWLMHREQKAEKRD